MNLRIMSLIVLLIVGCVSKRVIVTKELLSQDKVEIAIDKATSLEEFKEISIYLFIKGLKDSKVRKKAWNLLSGYVKNREVFKRFIEYPDREIKLVGYSLYNRKVKDEYNKELLENINIADSWLRGVVWYGVRGEIDKKLVIEGINDPNKKVRREAIRLLPVVLEREEAIDSLKDIIKHDPDNISKKKALKELFEIAPEQALSLIEESFGFSKMALSLKLNILEVLGNYLKKYKDIKSIFERELEESCSITGLISAKYLLEVEKEKVLKYLEHSFRCEQFSFRIVLYELIKSKRLSIFSKRLLALLNSTKNLKKRLRICEVLSSIKGYDKQILECFKEAIKQKELDIKIIGIENLLKYEEELEEAKKDLFSIVKRGVRDRLFLNRVGAIVLSSGKSLELSDLVRLLREIHDLEFRLYVSSRILNL